MEKWARLSFTCSLPGKSSSIGATLSKQKTLPMSESVFRVEQLELTFNPKPWAFSIERRAEIDAYFAQLQRDRPSIWNGRILLMHHQFVRDGLFFGEYLETDYASFSAWRAWGQPRAGVSDCFGAAAIVAADGACLLGVMGSHTFNAGQMYFPCGVPDPDDIKNGKVDLDFSVRREVREETGLDSRDVMAEPGWIAVVDGSLVALIKLLRTSEPAQALRARMLTHLAREKQPELSDITIVRCAGDFTPAMPRFVTAFLGWHFGVR
jgi:8-oxo-dGTP pyrophosphatase MutT (NUDIX family)